MATHGLPTPSRERIMMPLQSHSSKIGAIMLTQSRLTSNGPWSIISIAALVFSSIGGSTRESGSSRNAIERVSILTHSAHRIPPILPKPFPSRGFRGRSKSWLRRLREAANIIAGMNISG